MVVYHPMMRCGRALVPGLVSVNLLFIALGVV